MAGVAHAEGRLFRLQQAEMRGDAAERFALGGEESELIARAGHSGTEGVFHDGGQHAVGHGETSLASAVELVGQQPQGVGVAFEMDQVGPLLGGKLGLKVGTGAFGEEGGDGRLARMAERRVAEVVGQTGRTDNFADGVESHGVGRADIARAQGAGYHVGHRPAYRRNFHAVGQAVVDKDAARKGENLRLVLQPAEGGGEHKPVEIALEIRARAAAAVGAVVVLHAEAAVADQATPLHGVAIGGVFSRF